MYQQVEKNKCNKIVQRWKLRSHDKEESGFVRVQRIAEY